MTTLSILGSTGSIGTQALDIIAAHPDRFSVFALSAHRNVEKLYEQCVQFLPQYAVMVDEAAAFALSQKLKTAKLQTEVLVGEQALAQVAADTASNTVLAAIVGSPGLPSTMAAVRAGKRVLLANKESLVMAGALMTSALREYNAEILPVDSEHNAIFQCLPSDFRPGKGRPQGVESIVLTASGGPFRLTPVDALASVTPKQAVAHPNWSMGRKVSVDSATMMNKGLEIIEAHWLFGLPVEQLEVVIHPQSIVHSMVKMQDGSVLAHLAKPDMHVPIAHALAWPDRIASGVSTLDFANIGRLEFEKPSLERYPCLALAYEALRSGAAAMVVLNAANEVAVSAFLDRSLRFDQISQVVSEVLNQLPLSSVETLEAVLDIDHQARRQALRVLGTITMDPIKARV